MRLLGRKLYRSGKGVKAYSLYLKGYSKGFVWMYLSVWRCGELTFAVKNLRELYNLLAGERFPHYCSSTGQVMYHVIF